LVKIGHIASEPEIHRFGSSFPKLSPSFPLDNVYPVEGVIVHIKLEFDEHKPPLIAFPLIVELVKQICLLVQTLVEGNVKSAVGGVET
jgi:hypothetical protein